MVVQSTTSHSSAAPAFLLGRQQSGDPAWDGRTALAAALVAERADRDSRRNTRSRIAYLLGELGCQLSRLGAARDGDLPLSRTQIANALGISLCRVKRTLALLSLSQVIATDGRQIRVLDWRRLCALAGFDASRLQLKDEDFEGALITGKREPRAPQTLTASGDPACFV